ncbi:MAG: nucleotide exchange factor GrpE [Bacteroidota bacterium]
MSSNDSTREKENHGTANEPVEPVQLHEDELADSGVEQSDPIAALEAQLSASRDQYLRLVAEFENYKKRMAKERTDLTRMANSDLLLSLLPVVDDFERAMKAASDSGAVADAGVVLIHQKFKAVLEAKGVKTMDAAGAAFDSDIHEAIAQVPAPSEEMKGKVLEELVRGYFLHDKVLRHAKVVVGI